MPDTVEVVEVDEIDGKLHCVSLLGMSRDKEAGQRLGQGLDAYEKHHPSADRFNSCTGVDSFFNAVLDTALNWADTELMAMPGYRDRIVHVKLAPNEGGNQPEHAV